MAKPTAKINWTKGNPNFALKSIEPSAGKKENGFDPAERPPAQTMNWLLFNICDWIDYLEGISDNLLSLQGVYDAVIGTGGTHANFNDLVADPDWAAGSIKSIFVSSTVAFDAPITIDQDDVTIVCKPGVTLAGTTSANRAFILTAARTRILQCRFNNFVQPGDAALELNGAVNPMILQNYFANNTAIIEDTASTDPVIAHNVEE